jgi:hypothetical protein
MQGLALVDRASNPEIISHFPVDELPEETDDRLILSCSSMLIIVNFENVKTKLCLTFKIRRRNGSCYASTNSCVCSRAASSSSPVFEQSCWLCNVLSLLDRRDALRIRRALDYGCGALFRMKYGQPLECISSAI